MTVFRWRAWWLATVLSVFVSAACGSPRHTPAIEPGDNGALLGAYVSPSVATDDGRIQAIEGFESALGRPLAVIQTYHEWTVPFPTRIDRYVSQRGAVLLLSWAATSPSKILDGRYDAMIRQRAKDLGKLGTPVLLRWRWEMNRPNLRNEIPSADEYVKAWKHVRSVFDDEKADNVDWVWCPLANGFEETDAPSYYPGDDQVEWLCADAYTTTPTTPLSTVLDPFLDWAKGHDRPIIIAEFGTHQGQPGERAAWLDAAFRDLKSSSQVKAVVYYESANAPAGRYDIAGEADTLQVMRTWGAKPWLNPAWTPK